MCCELQCVCTVNLKFHTPRDCFNDKENIIDLDNHSSDLVECSHKMNQSISLQTPAPVSLKHFSIFATKKALALCNHLQLNGYTPKSFLNILLLSKNSDLAFRRRLWTTGAGWSSTCRILKGVKLQAQRSEGVDRIGKLLC